MSFDAKYIKEKAIEYGAAVCGIASVERFKNERPECNPASISPYAKSVIGIGFYVPSGFYRAMENGNQNYQYTSVGVKYIDEEMTTIFLYKMAAKKAQCLFFQNKENLGQIVHYWTYFS